MKKIAITIGDPAGIGPEICCKIIKEQYHIENCKLLFIGHKSVLQYTMKHVLKSEFTNSFEILEPENLTPIEKVDFGIIKPEYGKASMLYVKKAVELALKGNVDAIVTCPINKKSIKLGGFDFPGHTEFLGHLCGTDKFSMMLVGDKIKVILVTTHLPIKEVAKNITEDKIKTAIINAHSAGKYFGKTAPKIAVCGLNPHAGDNGAIGDEEIKIIKKAIEKVREKINVFGPYPADSLFPKVLKNEFDFVVCMYHDQGLIPVKMESFGSAVNVTLNLPIIRTSVDHGTAFDIAGKNIADPSSLKRAIKVAYTMVENVKSVKSL